MQAYGRYLGFIALLLSVLVIAPGFVKDDVVDSEPLAEDEVTVPSETEPPPELVELPTEPASPPPPEPTATPPAPTPTAGPPQRGEVLFSDIFDDVTRANFPLSSTDPSRQSQGYVDGQYEIVNGDPTGEARAWRSQGAALPTALSRLRRRCLGVRSRRRRMWPVGVGDPGTRAINLECSRPDNEFS